ncbi:DUF4396 domain-containing protein [Nocardioides bruguierae]|uniref:DUF4396 domain-containing protein n=1 Tax=Nocardioides bruguierae TaxID=2945102 RepID=A0A9X2D6T0_9ACTN|nr:DUF4396 domain-containing protein [Nocardioides bruguierae]MCM0620238.1 DUF4396 domain-containing protein [Nocardioides bruguierae]
MDTSWKMAATATRHCLTGCAAGEIVGMILAAAFAWQNLTSVAVSFVLAFVFGYSLTFWGVKKAGFSTSTAVKAALASDTVSILVMELVDNGFIALIPGALAATLTQWLFWWTLALSLAIAFLVAVPVNKWLMDRGLGHAKVHELHGHSGGHGGGHEGHEMHHTAQGH